MSDITVESIQAARAMGAFPWSHLSGPSQIEKEAGRVVDFLLDCLARGEVRHCQQCFEPLIYQNNGSEIPCYRCDRCEYLWPPQNIALFSLSSVAAAELRGQATMAAMVTAFCGDYAEKCRARAKSMGSDESFGIADRSYNAAHVADILTDEIRALSPDPSFHDRTVEQERARCAKIAEIVNDSIKNTGKFAVHILNPNTCIVPLSGGGNALRVEHVFDNNGQCVYCAKYSTQGVTNEQ